MLVFSTAKLVFLSVPKTGTTAYEEALKPHASMWVGAPPELKHAPVFRYNRFYRPVLEKFIADDLTVLAVMREPVSWLGSWYRYRQRDAVRGHRTSTHDISFDAFVDEYLKGQSAPFANVGSQAKFLEPQKNGTAVTHLFRYEDQAGLRAFLQNRLGVQFETKQHNASPARVLELSEKTRNRLLRKMPKEFELYNGIKPEGAYTPVLL
ncbi:MAG: gamma-glutamyl kinase [Roseovarius sp.]